jgi:hypothetical protein
MQKLGIDNSRTMNQRIAASINAKLRRGKSIADKAYLFVVDLHFLPFPLIIR